MAASSAFALFLTLNLLFFVISSSCGTCPCPTPKPPTPGPIPKPPTPGPIPKPPTPAPIPKPPTPGPIPKPPTPGPSKCPIDTLKLGVCADVLGLIHLKIGKPPKVPCCSLLGNLANLEAAICLCTALKANILGINLNIPINLSLILNYCGQKVPPGFQCA